MIRVNDSAVTLDADPGEVAAARVAWERGHHLAFPRWLEGRVLDDVTRALGEAAFVERVHRGISSEACVVGGRALAILQFRMNDPRLFAMVRELTGAPAIGCFEGRIYRQVAGADHHDSWHDDASRTRVVALSINLGAERYAGGVLQIRDRRTDVLVAEVENTRPGAAILFRIAPYLEHRISPVSGSAPKTAFAGWFRERPDYRDLVAGRAQF